VLIAYPDLLVSGVSGSGDSLRKIRVVPEELTGLESHPVPADHFRPFAALALKVLVPAVSVAGRRERIRAAMRGNLVAVMILLREQCMDLSFPDGCIIIKR
jgi:hypothetical protein